MQNLGKNSEKHGLALTYICLAKKMQHIMFYAYVHVCNPNYIDEE